MAPEADRSGHGDGHVAYMSPEQARAEEVDARTDLFSFGAVLYEMATGRRAFLKALDWTGACRPNSLPPELRRIVLKLLQADRELRYQTAADVAADLRRLQHVERKQAGLAALVDGRRGGAGALVVRIAAIFYLRPDRPAGRDEWVQLTNFPDSGQPTRVISRWANAHIRSWARHIPGAGTDLYQDASRRRARPAHARQLEQNESGVLARRLAHRLYRRRVHDGRLEHLGCARGRADSRACGSRTPPVWCGSTSRGCFSPKSRKDVHMGIVTARGKSRGSPRRLPAGE